MSGSAPKDVFISYNASRDHAEAGAIAVALRQRGLKVFFDRWHLKPGRSWPEALERHLDNCGSVAILLGSGDLGRWQQREKYLALHRQATDASFAVIPVLLPGADMPTGFLSLETWVDLRGGVHNEETLALLEAAVRGQAPEALLAHSRKVKSDICPYRGLEVFREEDADFFFGRDAFTEQLVDKVQREPVVAVVGPSGSGKSSVVRAGLVPALRQVDNGKVWEVLTLVPGREPLHSLAGLFVPILEPDCKRIDQMRRVNETSAMLADGEIHLHQLINGVIEEQPGTERLLLFIDQWEELYTYEPDDDDDQALHRQTVDQFVDALFYATKSSPVTIALTLRADFFNEALRHRRLADALSNGQVNLGPLDDEELAQTIQRPADEANLQFESGLAERLQTDVGNEPGNLALLEFALKALWDRRQGPLLTHEAYQEIGCVSGAIASRAEEAYRRLDADDQACAEHLFRALVRPGEEERDTRRRARLGEFSADVQRLARELAGPNARLLVLGSDDRGKETVEVAHEALLREWPRLRDWIDEQREALRQRDRVTAAAREWDNVDRPDVLLWPHEVLDPTRQSLGSANLLKGLERDSRLAEFLRPEADRLLAELAGDSIDHSRREYIGMRLSEIGDPRPGVGVIDGVPDILWCRIEARGRVRIDVKEHTVEPFQISSYPVTYSQYQAFLNAQEGHQREEWSNRPEMLEWRRSQLRRFASYPAENISWYDATAFCRWLSSKIGTCVALPTEWQWEWAARSSRLDWEYPWGSEWKTNRANTSETGLGRTTAVGMFFQGRSAQGVHDLAGNVWEWCANKEFSELDNSEAPNSGKSVLRGGSWQDNQRNARAGYRFQFPSDSRLNFIGFRVVLRSPIP